MTDDADLDPNGLLLTGELRPSFRPWMVAVIVNLVLATFLIGIPYLRGPSRAAEVPARFAAFAACFYDAPPNDPPGLGLPRGERARYATLVLGGDDDWPARCRDELEALPPDESMFLFPEVKGAEAHLRAAVELMSVEMETLIERRAAGTIVVTDRPMRAMATLRGALAELGLTVSQVRGLRADRDAVTLGDELSLPQASIIPLRVSEGGEWAIAVREGALLAGTMDSRAVVHVRVRHARVRQLITRRPGLVTGLLAARVTPWVVWSTSPTQCARASDGCVRRATGLAAFLEDRQILEPMMWLDAHPLGVPARAIHIVGSTAFVVAVAEDGARVHRFDLPEPEVRPLGEVREASHVPSSAEWPLPVAAGATYAWIDGDPVRLLYADANGAGLLELREGAVVTSFEGAGARSVAASCGEWLVLASDSDLVVRPIDGEVWHQPQRTVPSQPGRLGLVCRGPELEVFTLAERTLSRSLCRPGECGEVAVLLEDVARFDVVDHRGTTLVAWTDDAEDGAVRVSRATADGLVTAIPAPCWSDPPDGLCGEPRLASDGETLMLATRQGEDLRVLRSTDGVRFEPLIGVERR